MKHVLVTTEHRGVFFGELIGESKQQAELKNARCAIYFGTSKGFLELAKTGPTSESKIGDEVEYLKIYDITSVAGVTEEAARKWKSA